MDIKSVTSCLGYQQITDLSAATRLVVPTTDANGLFQKPVYAIIIATGQSVRWRDDGTAPTATIGMPLLTNIPLDCGGNVQKIRFIEQTGGAVLNISYYA